MVRGSHELPFCVKVLCQVCDRRLLSGMRLRNVFRRPIYGFVIMFDDAAKHKANNVEANLFVRKWTLNDTVASSTEKEWPVARLLFLS